MKPRRVKEEKDGMTYVRVTLTEKEWDRVCEERNREEMREKIEKERARIRFEQEVIREIDRDERMRSRMHDGGWSAGRDERGDDWKDERRLGRRDDWREERKVDRGGRRDERDDEVLSMLKEMRTEMKGLHERLHAVEDRKETGRREVVDVAEEDDVREEVAARGRTKSVGQKSVSVQAESIDMNGAEFVYVPQVCRDRFKGDEVDEERASVEVKKATDEVANELRRRTEAAKSKNAKKRELHNVRRQIENVFKASAEVRLWPTIMMNLVHGWELEVEDCETFEDMIHVLATMYQ